MCKTKNISTLLFINFDTPKFFQADHIIHTVSQQLFQRFSVFYYLFSNFEALLELFVLVESLGAKNFWVLVYEKFIPLAIPTWKKIPHPIYWPCQKSPLPNYPWPSNV